MELSLIAAVGKNNELGNKNKLIWYLPNDLKFFRKMTENKCIVMGRNTFFSLPILLPNRKHIVITKNNILNDNVYVCHSIKEFLDEYKDLDEEIFVIGGASIYKEFIDMCDKLYITEINASKEADTYFPDFDKSKYEKYLIDSDCNDDINYKHVLYKRRKNER